MSQTRGLVFIIGLVMLLLLGGWGWWMIADPDGGQATATNTPRTVAGPDAAADDTANADDRTLVTPAPQPATAANSGTPAGQTDHQLPDVDAPDVNGDNDEVRVDSLDWLSKHQSATGMWSAATFVQDAAGKVEGSYAGRDGSIGYGDASHDGMVTGLALLGYLGAGYTHTEGPYKDSMRNALKAMRDRLRTADNDGGQPELIGTATDVYANYGMLAHAVMTMAMCEAYGMTGANMLKGYATDMIAFALRSQLTFDDDGRWLGWGRTFGDPLTDPLTTGWMVMALKSATICDIRIPDLSERLGGAAAHLATFVSGYTLTDSVVVLARQFAGATSISGNDVRTYTVAAGDRLVQIARKVYGAPHGSLWPTIADANGITDPAQLHPGSILTIPPIDEQLAALKADTTARGAAIKDALDHRAARPIEPFAMYLSLIAMFQSGTDGARETLDAVGEWVMEQQHTGTEENPDLALRGTWDVDPAIAVAVGRPGMTALGSLMLEIFSRTHYRVNR